MRPFLFYIALTAVMLNVGANMAANTAQSLHDRQMARHEQLCKISPDYCL